MGDIEVAGKQEKAFKIVKEMTNWISEVVLRDCVATSGKKREKTISLMGFNEGCHCQSEEGGPRRGGISREAMAAHPAPTAASRAAATTAVYAFIVCNERR